MSQKENSYLQGSYFPSEIGSAGKTRTYNPSVNSRMLCH